MEIADESGKTVKTYAATSTLSDDMEEINRPDAAPEAVNKAEAMAHTPARMIQDYIKNRAGEISAGTIPDAAAHESQNCTSWRMKGFSPLPDGSVIATRINAVRIVLASSLTPVLLLDGKEIPADRIGFSMKDSESDKKPLFLHRR